MLDCIPEPNAELSKYAPKIISFNIDPEKIKDVIGSGGKTINKIIAETGVKIDIDETGKVFIATYDETMDRANQAKAILQYTDCVLCCDIHTRARTKRILKAAGANRVCGLDDILTSSVDGNGYNEAYGLLGSNKSTEDTIKLFPRECKDFVLEIQKLVLDATGKHVEVMVYGDGAFKDPQGKIWELADPVVSPAFTKGLIGTPNELKLKYLADNEFSNLSGEELKEAIKGKIQENHFLRTKYNFKKSWERFSVNLRYLRALITTRFCTTCSKSSA